MPDPLVQGPVAVFLTIMAVILISPLLSQWARLPGIIGLIIGGLLVGPNGLNLLATERTIELLSTVGLLYLMFNAGLEIDLQQFNRVKGKSVLFGVLTFIVPQLSGIALGRILNFGWAESVLLGSLYASHTLVAFPILSRLRILRNEAVSVTIGATVFTDVLALLVLAIIVGTQEGGVSFLFIAQLIGLMILYAVFVLLGLPRLGRRFFQRFSSPSIEFQFIIVALFVSALLAELIGMHAIVGAFLAGLAINSALPPHSRALGRVLFVGESFFIPLFLMYIGMVLNPLAMITDPQTLLLGVLLTVAVYSTKYIAAWLAARFLKYDRNERMTMWGLSQAQAAATLATVLVANEAGLFGESLFNAAIMTVLFTTITSPLIVQRFGSRLIAEVEPSEEAPAFERILIPVANPATQEHLINLASLLVRAGEGTLLPLNVALEVDGTIRGLQNQEELLSADVLTDPDTNVVPIRRVDTSVSGGILRAAVEHDASLIVLGWQGEGDFTQTIFGSIVDRVVWRANIPVLVAKIDAPIDATRRIVMVVPENAAGVVAARRSLPLVLLIASALDVPVRILTPSRFRRRLEDVLAETEIDHPYTLVEMGGNPREAVAENAGSQDLIILATTGSTQRFRSSLGSLAHEIANSHKGSTLVVHQAPNGR